MADTAQHIGVYTGVFDPVHLGHLDVIRRGSRLFDRLVVGVGENPEKTPMFSQEERVELVRKVVADMANVEVRPFEGLAVRFKGAGIFLQIFAGAELLGIDEDRNDDWRTLKFRCVHQRKMALMQGAHGGDQAERAAIEKRVLG